MPAPPRRFAGVYLRYGAIVAGFVASTALAGDGFSATWTVQGSGGAHQASGGGYSLGATMGQPVAGFSAGGGYTLDAGYWQTAAPTQPLGGPIFNDGFED